MNDPSQSSAETSENRPSGHTLFPLASHTYTQTHTRPSPSLPHKQSHAFLHELIIPESKLRDETATLCNSLQCLPRHVQHSNTHFISHNKLCHHHHPPSPSLSLSFPAFCLPNHPFSSRSPPPSSFSPLTFAAVENDDIHSVPPHILQNTCWESLDGYRFSKKARIKSFQHNYKCSPVLISDPMLKWSIKDLRVLYNLFLEKLCSDWDQHIKAQSLIPDQHYQHCRDYCF